MTKAYPLTMAALHTAAARLGARQAGGRTGPSLALWSVVTLAAFLLYLLTLSNHWTGDSLEFALAVDQGALVDGIEAHQLLVHPLGFSWFSV